MNFSIRTMMLNVTYVAAAIAAWCSGSELFLALVTFLFIIMILRSVACCFIASENRAFWIGSATISVGILFFSHYLVIFDAIAAYENQRRFANYALPVIPTPSLVPPSSWPSQSQSPSPSSLPNPSPTFYLQPSISTAFTWGAPPAYAPWSAATFSFGSSGGFAEVMKAFLISAVAYLFGTIAGVICTKVCVVPLKMAQEAA